jgi:ribose transport system permease protein
MGDWGPIAALILIVLFFAIADSLQERGGRFLSVHNLRTILVQAAPIAIAALGMTLIIIAGGIDLSVGTALALCATVLAWCLLNDVPPWLAILACLLAGLGTGLVNGILVSTLRVVPFIVTLGTMTAYLGIAKILADETTVRPGNKVPEWLPTLVQPIPEPSWSMVAPGVWLLLVLAIVVAALLRYSVLGRHLFAIGSSEATARLCGIPLARTKIAVYVLAGLFVGIAGIYQFARLRSGNPTSGLGLELKIIAAVVIGGGSLSGGRGSVAGTLAGALIMQVIASGCTQLSVPNPWQDIILGVIIVAAVTVDQLRQRNLAV